MSKIKLIIVSMLLPVFGFGVALSIPVMSVSAADCPITVQGGANCAKSTEQKSSVSVVFRDITNVLLFIIGAVAVIMLIIGGIRYTTSGGDSSQVTAAKNTILYAVIGIIVALLAYAIVNFVVGAFTKDANTPDDAGGTSAAS